MLGVSGMFIEEFRPPLYEGRTGARLDNEIVADQRADERTKMGLLRLGHGVQEFLLLPFQQLAELLRALRNRHGQGLHAPGREQHDHLGPKHRVIFAVGRVEHDHGSDTVGMRERVSGRFHRAATVSDDEPCSPDAFEIVNLPPADQRYDIHLLSEHGGPVRSSAGMTLQTEPFGDPALGSITEMDMPSSDATMIAFVQEAAKASRRIASICSGAFVLAEAGLLSGRCATMHWAHAASFRARFPDVRAEEDTDLHQ